MRTILLALLLFSQNIIVKSSFMNYMSGKFNDFARVLDDVGQNIKLFFEPPDVEYQTDIKEEDTSRSPFVYRHVSHDMKSAFDDFIDFQKVNSDGTDFSKRTYHAYILATPLLAQWHGRDMESHVVQTKDDYFLTVYHLVSNSDLQANRTVLLHHGLLGSSTDWILLGPTKSLPYMLSDAGFDVWITNVRGNYYSRGHAFKQTQCLEYWKFSFQEMGEFDLPAVIDYIIQTKNSTQSINFIGHSMGATALMVLLSTMPKYNQYLRMGILLAPLVYMDHVKGPLKVLTRMSEEVIKLMGSGEFLPHRKIPSWLSTKYCKGPKILCSNPLLFLSGFHQDQRWNARFFARLSYHIPAGGSTNTLLHYMQISHSGKFHRFNHPDVEFSLNNITLPIALISSSDDWLATVPDVLKFYFNLLNPIDHFIIQNNNFTHTDLVWGVEADVLVFGKVLEYLEKGLMWNTVEQNEE